MKFLPCILVVAAALSLGFVAGRSGRDGKRENVSAPASLPRTPKGLPPVESGGLEATSLRARLTQGSRLSSLERLISRVGNADFAALERMQRDLFSEDKQGRDTRIERQIVLYQMGVLGGPDAVRAHFTADPDRSENQYGIVLEGWAQTDPGAALAWWASLPSGNLRASLLAPFLQGYLSARGGNWEAVAPILSLAELGTCARPILESTLEKDGLAAGLTFYEKHIGTEGWPIRSRVSKFLTERICDSRDPVILKQWFLLEAGPTVHLTTDQESRVLRELGAADGATALSWLSAAATPDGTLLDTSGNRMRIALGWVKVRTVAAGQWLEGNPRHPAADAVAFQLAIRQVKENPEKARHWAGFIGDSDLAGELEAILQRYEK